MDYSKLAQEIADWVYDIAGTDDTLEEIRERILLMITQHVEKESG